MQSMTEVRLRKHGDYQRVYRESRKHFSASMTVFYWPRPEAALDERVGGRAKKTPAKTPALLGLRVGFTVGRVLGGAVERNRIKRRMREAVRMTRPVAGVAADVVINPKKALLTADFCDVLNEVRRAFAVIEEKKEWFEKIAVGPSWAYGAACALLLLSVELIGFTGPAVPFVYFQF